MTRFGTGYTFGFAAALCAVLAVAVASASIGLRPIQEANSERDLHGRILGALDVPAPGAPPLRGEAIDAAWAERVRAVVIDDEGHVVPDRTPEDVAAEREAARDARRAAHLHVVYQRMDGDRVGAYGLEMSGRGLWGPLSGYLAVAPDGETVSGATFFAPQETPGLGNQVATAEFSDRWRGKKVFVDGQTVPVRVVKGDPTLVCPGREGQCVDGISGATLTSRGVDAMVVDALNIYEPYLERVRSGGAR